MWLLVREGARKHNLSGRNVKYGESGADFLRQTKKLKSIVSSPGTQLISAGSKVVDGIASEAAALADWAGLNVRAGPERRRRR